MDTVVVIRYSLTLQHVITNQHGEDGRENEYYGIGIRIYVHNFVHVKPRGDVMWDHGLYSVNYILNKC